MAEYMKVYKMPKDIQCVTIKEYLEKQGCFDSDSLTIVIGKTENYINRHSFNQAITLGLSYPAVILIITIVVTVLSILSIDNFIWFSLMIMAVPVIMLITANKLKVRKYIYDLVDLLYDFKYELTT